MSEISISARAKNFFSDFFSEYNTALIGGACLGVVAGFLFTGHALPSFRSLGHMVFNGRCKMVLVVRDDLHMSKGKIASQCSHATLQMHKKFISPSIEYGSGRGLLDAWQSVGEPTIVCRVNDLAGAKQLMKRAEEYSVPCTTIHDAGKTEVPANSLTVLAIGPANTDDVDEITGHLRTL